MELMALGTPEVPLNRVRVPRQAATAAKAAIKKDFMEQNRRLGTAHDSAATPMQIPDAADGPVPEPSPRAAVKRSALQQTVKQAKVLLLWAAATIASSGIAMIRPGLAFRSTFRYSHLIQLIHCRRLQAYLILHRCGFEMDPF